GGNAGSACAPPAAGGPGSRGRWVRLSRARLVAVEAAAGAAVGGAVLRGPLGWTVLVLAGPALLVAVTRRDGRWLTDLLAARLRSTAASVVAVAEPDSAGPGPGWPAARRACGLGAVRRVAPRLAVAECTDRNGYPLGVAWDGQGV